MRRYLVAGTVAGLSLLLAACPGPQNTSNVTDTNTTTTNTVDVTSSTRGDLSNNASEVTSSTRGDLNNGAYPANNADMDNSANSAAPVPAPPAATGTSSGKY